MVNILKCEECIHLEVCGKKDLISKFARAINNLNISMNENTGIAMIYAKDCNDIIVDFECKYRKKDYKLGTRSAVD